MAQTEWKNVSLPATLVDRVDKIVEVRKSWTSRANFIADAVRRYVEIEERYR